MTLGFDPEFAPNMKVQLNLSFSELQISSFECILGPRKILHEIMHSSQNFISKKEFA